MKAILFVLSLVLVFMIIGVVGHPTAGEDFDKNYLVLQWPQSFCNTGGPYRCQRIHRHFTIHGLWPQKNNKQVNCSGQPEFNYGLINGNIVLLDDLNKFWPNLTSNEEGNKVFWRKEWKRHGTCTTGIFGNEADAQRDYFNRAVALAKNVSLTNPLLIEGIIEPGKKYTTEEIKKAIMNATKLIPRLKCNRDTNKTHQLLEAILCVDKYARKLDHCTYDDATCPKKRNSQIAFPNPPVTSRGEEEHEEL